MRTDEHQLEREAIIAEALTWLGTPFVDCGYVRGRNGAADCAMFLIGVFSARGYLPRDYDPRPYNPDWHLHQAEELYLAGTKRFAHRVDEPLMGDIALYRLGRTASHGALVIDDDRIIHAHKHAGNVELCERRLFEPGKIDSFWSVFS